MSSGSAERAALFSSAHAETLSLIQERQRARGLNLPVAAVEPTQALIERHLSTLVQATEGMASELRETDAAARSGRVALAEVRQAEDDLTEAQTSLDSLLGLLGTDPWAAEWRSKIKALIKPPAPPQEVVESEASQPGGSKPGGPQAQTQTEAQRAAYYHDDVEDDTEASAALLQSQQLQMDDQDAQLDLLGHSIQRQQHLSLQMNEELGRHSELLDDLDGAVDNTTSNLGAAHRRLNTFRRVSRDNGCSLSIIGLIIVLVLLIALVK